ncbi:MAG: hypothetical protein RL662_1056 [Bacteroidota bacterium]|jgi:hypothetical protein
MADYMLDTNLIAQIIFKLLPHKPPYILTMDRTNWKFGQTNINILTIGIAYQVFDFPLIYMLLPKRENSSTQERFELMKRYIHLFGKETIAELLADGELVREQWLEYLNREQICYHLRIKNNFWVIDPRKQKRVKASHLFNRLSSNQTSYLKMIYSVSNQLCYLSASKIKKKYRPELHIIESFSKPENAIESYKQPGK